LCVMVVLHFALQSNYQYIHIAMKWSYHWEANSSWAT
jgi:hypothetical protein